MTGTDERPGQAGPSTPDGRPSLGQALRRHAEERVREDAALPPESREPLSPEKTAQALHELRVHQIELEMQNEELRRAQAELDAARARYFDLYELAPVGYCTLSGKGLIVEANLTAASLLGVARSALVRQPLSRFVLKEDQDIYYLHRKQLFKRHAAPLPGAVPAGPANGPQTCELRMVKPDGTVFWAHLAAVATQDEEARLLPSREGQSSAGPSANAETAPPTSSGPAGNDETVCRVTLSDVTERKRAEEILVGYNEALERRVAERTAVAENRARQLQALDRRLICAEEAERQRIAHVLHEQVQQILMAARMTLCTGVQRVKLPDAQEPFQAVDRMLRDALAEIRVLVHQMVPPGLREGGLLEAVTWLSRQMRERFDLSVTVTAEERLPPLDDEVSICAYHAVREMLQNIGTHAKVRHAEVVFRRQADGWMNLCVRDGGVGFTVSESAAGGGLVSIRERVEGFGGRMEIVSAKGQGTSVSLILPAQEPGAGEPNRA